MNPIHRYALLLEYDGTDFVGWQYQKTGRSVQAVMDSAVMRAFGSAARGASGPSRPVAAGRTDAGVHARGQVAHLDLAVSLAPSKVVNSLNEFLPEDCQVRAAEEVPADFHARQDARMKRYVYRLADGDRPVLERRFVAHVPTRLDETLMREAAALWLGKHDFTAFRDRKCEAGNPLRTMSALGIRRKNHLVITFEAKSFLHHQVRNMVSALVEVGRGGKPVAWASELLAATERDVAGGTMPAKGLSLERIEYAHLQFTVDE